MQTKDLSAWLAWMQAQNASAIHLELGRVQCVAKRLGLDRAHCPVITVGGTNGKGSTVAVLEAMYQRGGYAVGAFTSPYLYDFVEQVRINQQWIDPSCLCELFDVINRARGEIVLTIFEFKTLAALLYFQQKQVDVMLLEVGLGGRLDAVNVVPADVAVITSIDLDHCDWLGDTREAIGFEKMGIVHSGASFVCGELKPPQSVFEALQAKSVRAFFANHDFSWHIEGERWSCVVPGQYYRDLPLPPVLVQNAANAFMAAHCLKQQRPLSEVAMTDALRHVSILGRLQHVSLSGVDCVFDVAHNVASAAILRQHLGALEKPGRCVALVALQQSKDLTGIVSLMSDVIDEWHGICLPNPMPFYCCEALEAAVRCQAPSAAFYCVSDSALAFKQVRARLRPGDRLLVFGSFYLVGPLLQSLAKEHAHEITALA